MKKLLLTIITFCAIANNGFATIRYVDVVATGANNGSSWTNAYTDLQSALTTAVAGDTIWVAAGVYKPVSSFPQSEAVSLDIPSGVAVYGGFGGTETDISQRNLITNITTLSGDILGNPTFGSWHVVTMNAVSNTTRLDGFVIADGYADGVTLQNKSGGGLYVTGNSSPTIANCTFTTNYAEDDGGGMFIRTTAAATVINCTVVGNASQGFGGGAYFDGHCTVLGSSFTDNESFSAGGGAYFEYGNVTIDRCVFSANTSSYGGGLFFGGGAIGKTSNSLIAGNVAIEFSYAISLASPNNDAHEIRNCTIVHNRSTLSAQESVQLNAASQVRNSIIWGNDASSQLSTATTLVSNSIVQGLTTGVGNINADPEFTNPANINLVPFNAAAYSYVPKAFSPAIDKGNSTYLLPAFTYDLAGNGRSYGNAPDMGAYEREYCPLSTTITYNTPNDFCQGGSVVLTANAGYHYAWSTGQTTMSITASTSGDYIVAISDSACRGYDTVNVTVYPLPVPVITATGGVLSTASTFTAYQWSLNGVAIPNATNNTYTPTANGNYTVAVTGTNSCEGVSAIYSFITGVGELANNAGVTLSPVPAKNYVALHFTGFNNQRCQVRICNLMGSVVLIKDILVNKDEKHTLDINDIAPGMYYVDCISGGKRVTVKMVVQ